MARLNLSVWKHALLWMFLALSAAFAHAQWVSYPGFSSDWGPYKFSVESTVAAAFKETELSPVGSASPYGVQYNAPNYELQLDYYTNAEGYSSGTVADIPASAFPYTTNYLLAIETTAVSSGGRLPYIQVVIDGVTTLAMEFYPTGASTCSGCVNVGEANIWALNNSTAGEYAIFAIPTIAGNTPHNLQIFLANPCVYHVTGCSALEYAPGPTLTLGQVILWSSDGFGSYCNVSSGGHVTSTELFEVTGSTYGFYPSLTACKTLGHQSGGTLNHWLSVGGASGYCEPSNTCNIVEIFD